MEYKSFLNKTLPMEEHRKTNRYAPEGTKFCNAICQDYRELSEFSGIVSIKTICKYCINTINKAKKAIENKQITLKDFKNNPHMFDEIKTDEDITSQKQCTKCGENKSLIEFYEKKTICKGCICISRATERSKIDNHVKDIENLKNNLYDLEKYVKNICKEKLTCIISHFGVGRKASDTKPKMVENIVNHFRKLQNPLLCLGGCGFTLQQELSTCEECKKKNQKTKSNCGIRNVTFEDCIDDIIENLKPGVTDNELNKDQVFKIARKLGIGSDKLTQANSKEESLKILNDFLEKREEEEKQKIEQILDIIPNKTTQSEIMLNGVTVLAREGDGFINATMLCKAGGKQFSNWYQLESTKQLINALEDELSSSENNNDQKSDIGIQRSEIMTTKNSDLVIQRSGIMTTKKIIDIKKGGNDKKAQGSWIHPDLAVQLAQWLSPVFALKVSKWVREIALAGTVTVGQEKNNEQLLILQQEVLKERETSKELEKKYRSILYKRSYHKFKKGPIFYIISDGFNKNQYKVGIDDVDINVRFQQHRTSLPNLQVHFIVYTKDNRELESTVLKRHKESRKMYLNHEWLFGIELKNIVDTVQTYLKFIGSEYNIEEDIDKYNS